MKKIEYIWTDISTNEYKLTIPDLQDPSGNKKYRFYLSNNDLLGNSVTSGNKTISKKKKGTIFVGDEPTSLFLIKNGKMFSYMETSK